MNDYILGVTFAIIFCVGVNLLVPSAGYMGIMKIICGVFVVYTILTPIKSLINYDGSSLKINEFIDEGTFSFTMEKSKQDFEKAMSQSSVKIVEDAIEGDLSKMQISDVGAELRDDTVYITDASEEDCDAIMEYIHKQYGLKTVFR